MKDQIKTQKLTEAQMKDRAKTVTEARQRNTVLEEQLRFMKMEMELPGVRKQYTKFVIRRDFIKGSVQPTPWVLRWMRWIQYPFVVMGRRSSLRKYLSNIDDKLKEE